MAFLTIDQVDHILTPTIYILPDDIQYIYITMKPCIPLFEFTIRRW